MGDVNLNMDFSLPVIIEAGNMNWTTSPAQGVERRRLERENAESGRATSIVRFAPGSSFPTHIHGGGEEYLVLDGTFSDEKGDFGKGFYVRNPPGSKHAPSSKDGCTIFVKLCAMEPEGEPQIEVDTNALQWEPGEVNGHSVMALFEGVGDVVKLEKLEPDVSLDAQEYPGGLELLVLEGEMELDGKTYGSQTWMRYPAGSSIQLSSSDGCTYWSKSGHLK